MRALFEKQESVTPFSATLFKTSRRLFVVPRRSVAMSLVLAAITGTAFGQGLAVRPTEIRIGTTSPITGPAPAYSVQSKVFSAYFDKVNAEGGINGRRINMIVYDDNYDPKKTLELTRKQIEEDQVLFILGTAGTAANAAIQSYLNSKKVPHLLSLSGAEAMDQPREFPWTMGFLPTYVGEAHIYAQYLLENHPRSKIAVLYQDDLMGTEYLKGLKEGLSGKVPIAIEIPYKVTDTNLDPYLARMKATGADVFVEFTTPKFAIHGDQAKSQNSAGGRRISSPRSPIPIRL